MDEIHALVPTKRGAHLALSLERLEMLDGPPAAAHRAVGDAVGRIDEVARFLGGAEAPATRSRGRKRIGQFSRRGRYGEGARA